MHKSKTKTPEAVATKSLTELFEKFFIFKTLFPLDYCPISEI